MARLLLQLNIKEEEALLDFGCGTGSLAIAVKRKFPRSIVHGIDVDENVLRLARQKVDKSNLSVALKVCDGRVLPYTEGKFDKVISSLVFHHLDWEGKLEALQEIFRVLKVGGELHIVDFGKATSVFTRLLFLPVQLIDGFVNTVDNIEGKLPKIMARAGFTNIYEEESFPTWLGTVSFYRALKADQIFS